MTDGKIVVLPSYEEVRDDKAAFARDVAARSSTRPIPHNARPLLQPHGDEAVYFNPPGAAARRSGDGRRSTICRSRARRTRPTRERIPAFETVKHSIVTMRGCFGGCTFCSITEHEGRIIQSRSAESVLREVRAALAHGGLLAACITDVGGPDREHVPDALQGRAHRERLPPSLVRAPGHLREPVTDHDPLHRSAEARCATSTGIKRVFIASGVRYDLAERSPEFIRELAQHHTGGQLSVAPEHNDPDVLDKMKKPGIESYERFAQAFCQASENAGKEQYLVPYFITGHPGSTLKRHHRARALPEAKRACARARCRTSSRRRWRSPRRCTTPGIDPLTDEPVYTATRPAREAHDEGAPLLLGRSSTGRSRARPCARRREPISSARPRAVSCRPITRARGRRRKTHALRQHVRRFSAAWSDRGPAWAWSLRQGASACSRRRRRALPSRPLFRPSVPRSPVRRAFCIHRCPNRARRSGRPPA